MRPVTAVRDWARGAPGTVIAFVSLMMASAVWGLVESAGLAAWISAVLSVAIAYLIARRAYLVWQIWTFVLMLAALGGVLLFVSTPSIRPQVGLGLVHSVLGLILLRAPSTRRYVVGESASAP